MNSSRVVGTTLSIGSLFILAMYGLYFALARHPAHRKHPPKPPHFVRPTAAELFAAHVNELGSIPILEYHSIDNHHNKMSRSPDFFRHDLQRLYEEGYRPISIHDFLNNRISVPLGTTPVVLTFDDARKSQFCYLKDGSTDPDCAVGILQDFQIKHPDFPLRACFYILPWRGFDQPKYKMQKILALTAMGCEIGNHTVKHPILSKVTDERVRQELATCSAILQHIVPQAQVDTLALPYGVMPHNRALLPEGEFDGMSYKNRAVLLAGGNPARSPVSKRFKPMFVPRIEATEDEDGITAWLDKLKGFPYLRYVSDGDPDTVTIPKAKEDEVDRDRLNGAVLATY